MPLPSFDAIADAVSFGANLITLLLGAAAIWGLIFKRKEVALVLSAIAHAFVTLRMGRIKETLGKLENLNHDDKLDRPEINALIGQLCGQVRPLLMEFPQLKELSEKLQAAMAQPKDLTESHKRYMVYELHGILDAAALKQQGKSLGD